MQVMYDVLTWVTLFAVHVILRFRLGLHMCENNVAHYKTTYKLQLS